MRKALACHQDKPMLFSLNKNKVYCPNYVIKIASLLI
jgi:hypothetical protein